MKLEYAGGIYALAGIGDEDASVDIEWLGATMLTEDGQLAGAKLLAKSMGAHSRATTIIGATSTPELVRCSNEGTTRWLAMTCARNSSSVGAATADALAHSAIRDRHRTMERRTRPGS